MTAAVLEFAGTSKDYRGLRPLRIESLRVGAGEQVAILGLDQMSAEMFINLATGATLPDAGEIRVFGRATSAIADSTDWLATVDRFGIVSERAVRRAADRDPESGDAVHVRSNRQPMTFGRRRGGGGRAVASTWTRAVAELTRRRCARLDARSRSTRPSRRWSMSARRWSAVTSGPAPRCGDGRAPRRGARRRTADEPFARAVAACVHLEPATGG